MKLDNILSSDELGPLSRILSRPTVEQNIHPRELDDFLSNGWVVRKRLKSRVKVSKAKELPVAFPDRVWTLLYRMGFAELSGRGGAVLHCRAADDVVTNQVDVVAIDPDVALYIECRTAKLPHRVPKFAEDVAHIDGLRQCFQRAIKSRVGPRKVGALYWSQNHVLSENDVARAKEKNVHLFDEQELSYYEDLLRQIGAAARFQFLADVFGSARVDGLALKVPAVSVRLGPTRCFSFAISPEKLLKIAYVSHRAKGKSGDVDTYQRLLKRSRIVDIRDYVQAGGYFPTNIILNIRARRGLQFDKASTPGGVDPTVGDIGWLTLPAEYKSAWVIDGQHRLYAYADSDRASSAELTVLAFENLSESEQARLFVDINAKQKSVKQNLLMELWANLHWDSDNEDDRIRAIIAKLVLSMDTNPDSPFFNKIIKADEAKTDGRSISLQALSSALFQPEFFLASSKAGPVPGAFWSTDQLKTLRRAKYIVEGWFSIVVAEARGNWDRGKTEGGSLGMNDSVVSLILVLRSLIRYLSDKGVRLYDLSAKELLDMVQPYASCIASMFGAFTDQDFSTFRGYRGVEGQTRRMREIQLYMHQQFDDFNPDGLADYERSRDKTVMKEVRDCLDEIEVALNRYVVGVLKAEFGALESDWWFKGVPKQIRARILQEINEEGRDSAKESRFTLIDYRTIAQANWLLFKDSLAQGKNPGKESGTAWLGRVNEIRKFAAHPTKGSAKPEDLVYLRDQASWLETKLVRNLKSSTLDKPPEDLLVVEA